MSIGVQKMITAEEFAQLPNPADGSQQELVRGVIVTMPPPGGRHGACCVRIIVRLDRFVKDRSLGEVFSNDAGFITERDPDTVRGPDVSFWNRERLPEIPEGYIKIPPDLAVEVVSPGDHYSRVQNKVRHYLSRGVPVVWIVDPEDRSVTIYRAGSKQATVLEEADTLSGEGVLSEFSCPVRELFP